MTFPVVESVTVSVFNTNATSHLVAMPAVVNSGDLLIVKFMSTSVDAVTVPGTFTSLHTTTSGGSIRLTTAYRIADGTEDGGTADFVTATARRAVAHCSRISGWHGTTPPEVGTAATGTSTTPDPPSLTPSWGSADTTFLAEFGSVAAVTVSAYPTNYTNGQVDTFTAGAGGSVGSARRNLTATSDDPATFTISASGVWVAQTVAVRPVAGGAATVTPAIIAATTSLPTPAVLAASLVTPAVIPATATLPLPTAQGQAKPTPAVIAATVSLPTPTIVAASMVTPTAIAVTVSLPTPTIIVAGGPTTVTPAVITATVILPTPTILAAAKVTPAVIPVTVSLPTPTIFIQSAPQTVTPAVIAVTAALPTPTILAAATVTPSTIAVLVGLPTPTVIGGTTVMPAVIAVTVTFPGPTIILGAMTFWTPRPVAYTASPVGYTPVTGPDEPPWN